MEASPKLASTYGADGAWQDIVADESNVVQATAATANQARSPRRLSQGRAGTEVKPFKVPSSFVDELRSSAVPENMARQFPERPFTVATRG